MSQSQFDPIPMLSDQPASTPAPSPPDGGEATSPVRQATILLANRYFRRPSAPFGVWEGPQLGNLATLPSQDPDVIALLGSYQSDAQVNWVAV